MAGLFGFFFASVLVYAMGPALQQEMLNAASQSTGPVASLFSLLYYIHGFSVFIELVGFLGLIGGAKS